MDAITCNKNYYKMIIIFVFLACFDLNSNNLLHLVYLFDSLRYHLFYRKILVVIHCWEINGQVIRKPG
jgi:hypothetical protein